MVNTAPQPARCSSPLIGDILRQSREVAHSIKEGAVPLYFGMVWIDYRETQVTILFRVSVRKKSFFMWVEVALCNEFFYQCSGACAGANKVLII